MTAYKVCVLKTKSMYPNCTFMGFKCRRVVHNVGFRFSVSLGTTFVRHSSVSSWDPTYLESKMPIKHRVAISKRQIKFVVTIPKIKKCESNHSRRITLSLLLNYTIKILNHEECVITTLDMTLNDSHLH